MIRIAVDASCTRDFFVEFRGVNMDNGNEEIFHRGPFKNSSVNLGEVFGIILGLAWLRQQGHKEFVLYSDSFTAITWVRNRRINTALEPRPSNKVTFEMIEKGEAFLESCSMDEIFRVVKWDTKTRGEIPADFGRKGNAKGPRSEVPGRETKPKAKSRKKKQ